MFSRACRLKTSSGVGLELIRWLTSSLRGNRHLPRAAGISRPVFPVPMWRTQPRGGRKAISCSGGRDGGFQDPAATERRRAIPQASPHNYPYYVRPNRSCQGSAAKSSGASRPECSSRIFVVLAAVGILYCPQPSDRGRGRFVAGRGHAVGVRAATGQNRRSETLSHRDPALRLH